MLGGDKVQMGGGGVPPPYWITLHTIYCDEVKDVFFGNTGVKNTKNDNQYASQLFTVQYSKIHEIKS